MTLPSLDGASNPSAGHNVRVIDPSAQQDGPSVEALAAIVAGLERFMRETTIPAIPATEDADGWGRAAALEGVARAQRHEVRDPWTNT